MKLLYTKLLSDFSDIYFLNDYRFGLGMFLILAANPRLALCGVLAVLAAHAFAYLNGRTRSVIVMQGVYTYNPFLVGLAVGAYFDISAVSVGLVVVGGILALLVTAWLAQLADVSFRLPVLSLPFAILSLLILLVADNYPDLILRTASNVSAADILPSWLQWMSGYFRSLGAVVFLPEESVGILIAILILSRSLILFGLSFSGYFLGSALHAFLSGGVAASAGDFAGMNFILTAMALGGIFFVPCVQSLIQAGVGIFIAVLVTDGLNVVLSGSDLPVLSLPFVAATWLVCLGARIFENPMIPAAIGRTPEELLENNSVQRIRFNDPGRILHLPFAGEWNVWQGVDGVWTHLGLWKHALDFVITDAEGKTFSDSGQHLTDYFAFGKPVLAPCSGRIVKVVADLPDNPVGDVNQEHPWGNLVIIEHPEGWYVEISHFAAGSINVAEGQSIKKGALLGKCGNSGYSPQPHIHIQAQLTAVIGAATSPVSFSGFTADGKYHSSAVPAVGSRVRAFWPVPELERKTRLQIGDTFQMETFRSDEKIGESAIRVASDIYGVRYLESDRGKLYFGTRGDCFYFYRVQGHDPLLERIFAAIPKIPLVYPAKGCWTDRIPAGVVCTGLRRQLISAAGMICPGLTALKTHHRFIGKTAIRSGLVSKWAGKDRTVKIEFGQTCFLNRMIFDDMEIRFSPECDPAFEKTAIPLKPLFNHSAIESGLKQHAFTGAYDKP